MHEFAGRPTAMLAAVARAIYQLHYGPRALLIDWLAWPLVGAAAESMAGGSPPVLGELKQPFMTWFAALTGGRLRRSGRALGVSCQADRHVFSDTRGKARGTWISVLAPDELEAPLAEAGFDVIEDVAATDVQGRYELPSVHHERIALAHKPTFVRAREHATIR